MQAVRCHGHRAICICIVLGSFSKLELGSQSCIFIRVKQDASRCALSLLFPILEDFAWE
jgi:hypothetical protein